MSSIDTTTLLSLTSRLLDIRQDDSFFDHHQHYDDLVSCLIDHNHLYYIDNNPLISDHDYDMLFNLLKVFESLHPTYIRDDSPTQKLVGQLSHPLEKGELGGFDIQTEFKKSDHLTPILSLQNTYNSEDIMDRYESITTMLTKKIEEIDNKSEKIKEHLKFKTSNLTLLLESKYDGLSIVLTYKDGKLTQAVTRGDGYTGDDVTENIKTIKNLPLKLPSGQRGVGGDLLKKGGDGGKPEGNHNNTIILRGEVLMPKSTWLQLNTERELNGEQPFANTRNAAAGSLKLLDTNEVAKRGLVCYVYDVLSPPSEGGVRRTEGKSILQHFSQHITPPSRKDLTIHEVIDIISNRSTQETLLKADIDFDGLVIKIADPEIRELLGSTNHHPRRAIAYKFPAQQTATQIEHISRQVGRTGILTPVAHITPTILSGVTIGRVSLHNRDFITTKDIHLHDRVRLQRSGEVIPYIVSVITQRRTGDEKKLNPDDIVCPACGSSAHTIINHVGTKSRPEISTQLLCANNDCPGILKEQLKHFVSKNCMNINSIGEAIIDLLVDQQFVTSLSDIYTLTQSEKTFLLKRLPGIGEKKIDTFVAEIESSKTNPLRRLLNALGINGIGIKLAKEIEKQLTHHLVSLGGTKQSTALSTTKIFKIITQPDFLNEIYGIGEKIIIELQTRYTDLTHQTLLREFDQYGISPTLKNRDSGLTTRNTGSICITGTFPLSRSELEYYITQAGYTFTATLTKNTHYLFVGQDAGSKKDKVGPDTKVIDSIEEIYTMLGVSTPLFANPHQDHQKGSSLEQSTEMQSLFG